MPSRTLNVVVAGDVKGLKRSLGQAGQSVDQFERKTKRSANGITGFATSSSRGFGRVGVAARGMQVVAGGAAALLAKRVVEGASDINESLSKNQVLFGQYAKSVDQFSKTSASSFGISRAAALEYTGVFGNLFRALGETQQKSAGMSVGLTKLAADMASFNNTSIDDALEAIRSGIVGETEPLRRFGVNLNDATLRQQALAMGLTHTTKNVLTPHQRALAAVALITKQTSAAHGDFARTSGGMANQTRILQARVSDLGNNLGKGLLPAALAATKGINSFITGMQKGRGAGGAFSNAMRTAASSLRTAWASATGAISSYVNRNRAEFQSVGKAARNLGEAFQYVFRRVLLPAVRAVLPGLRQWATGVAQIVRGLVRIVTGLLTGDWKRAWSGVKDVVQGSLRSVVGQIRAFTGAITRVMRNLGVDAVRALVSGIKSGAKSVASAITAPFRGAAGAVKGLLGGIGEGVGKSVGLPPVRGVSGLDGANPIMGVFASEGSRFGLHVSSGRSSHSKYTSTGNVSYHSTGEAIDLANGQGPDASKMRAARFLAGKYGSRLAELIYSPLGFSIKNGQRVAPYAVADHYDHVHVALDTGKPGPGDGWGRRFTGDGIGQAVSAARKAGFKGSALVQAVAIAGAESRYRNSAKNLKPPDHSIGMWQINQLAHHGRFGSDAQLQNADANARAAWAISDHGRNFGPWSTWPKAAAGFLSRARSAVVGSRGSSQSAAGSTSGGGGGGGGQSISEMVAGEEERSRKTIARQGGTSIAPPSWSQRFAESDLAITISQGGSVQDQIGALTKQRLLIGQRISRVRGLLARKGNRALSRADRLKYTQELGTLIGNDRSAAESLFGLAAGTGVETPEPPSELDWLQAAAAEAGLTPDKADDIGAATGIRDLRARQLQFARAAGDPRGVAEFASALKDAQDALDGLTGSAQDAENAMKEHTDALNAVASELKRQTDFAQSVQSTESFQLKRALADVLSGAIAGRGIARSYAPGFGVEARY